MSRLSTILLGATIALLPLSSHAASTLVQFNTDGFTNGAGVITNNMPWALIFDTAGNGFESGSYCVDSPSDFLSADGFLTAGAGLSDDFVYTDSGKTTLNNAGPPINGNGGLITNINVLYDNLSDPATFVPLVEGMQFALVWSDGSSYGMVTDSTFVLPTSATDLELQTFTTGLSAGDKAATVALKVVPEPSSALLSALTISALALRRRK